MLSVAWMSLDITQKKVESHRQRHPVQLAAAVGKAAQVTAQRKGTWELVGNRLRGAHQVGSGLNVWPARYGWSPGSNQMLRASREKRATHSQSSPRPAPHLCPNTCLITAPSTSAICALCTLMLFLGGCRELALPLPSLTIVSSLFIWSLFPSGG